MGRNQQVPIIIIQGAQFGSEAKGAVAAHLGLVRGVNFAVRTGAINAGHTVVYRGQRFAMQQLPVGWTNPNTTLVLAPGAYIHPPTLAREIAMVNEAMPGVDVRDRLFIDPRCGTHTGEMEAAAKEANRHHRIGTTGKGCSDAIVGKIRDRNNGFLLFQQWLSSSTVLDSLKVGGLRFIDTVALLNNEIDKGATVLLEGTQGTHLDLHLGPYPFTTSRMTSAANWAAEAGLSPALDYEVVLVVRTYPIRVAGNSGPMTGEIEWADLARSINHKLSLADLPAKVGAVALAEWDSCLERAAANATIEGKYKVPTTGREFRVRASEWTAAERDQFRVAASELHRDALLLCGTDTQAELKKLFEMTTVTKKLRRIAKLSIPDLQYAIAINRPQWLFLSFLDYAVPEVGESVQGAMENTAFATAAMDYISEVGMATGVNIDMVSVGAGERSILTRNEMAEAVG